MDDVHRAVSSTQLRPPGARPGDSANSPGGQPQRRAAQGTAGARRAPRGVGHRCQLAIELASRDHRDGRPDGSGRAGTDGEVQRFYVGGELLLEREVRVERRLEALQRLAPKRPTESRDTLPEAMLLATARRDAMLAAALERDPEFARRRARLAATRPGCAESRPAAQGARQRP